VCAVAAGVLLAPDPASAQGGVTSPDLDDPCPAVYPGDSASLERIARWMARGAIDRGLPRELPVMAGLAECGLRNLSGADFDGYFGMHESLNTGEYRGFPSRPTLQLAWFLDTAMSVRRHRLATGRPDPAADERAYGLWIADVERPAPENRSGYQRYLPDAHRLLGERCPSPLVAEAGGPAVRLRIATRQAAGDGAVGLRVRCPETACLAGALLTTRVASRRRRARAAPIESQPGDWASLSVRVPRAALRQLAGGGSLSARLTAIGVDAEAHAASVERRLVLTP